MDKTTHSILGPWQLNLKDALDFYNILKMDLIDSKFPRWYFLKIENIIHWTAYYHNLKFRCFDLMKPYGPFSTVGR